MTRATTHITLLAVFFIVLLGIQTEMLCAEPQHLSAVDKPVHWFSKDPDAEVFLVKKGHSRFRLIVLTDNDFKVAYHTRRNSRIDVTTELQPAKSSSATMRVYEFRHGFSRTTIWMSVEFRKDGKRIEKLTRTFYGSIDKVVPNNEFLR